MGSGDFAGNKDEPLVEQFKTIKAMMQQKWPEGKYIAYFQANTNTYAPLLD
jgi:radical SAM superfamily enzyme